MKCPRGFCEVCDLMTHDSGCCLIQNGGPEEGPDDSNDECEMQKPVNRTDINDKINDKIKAMLRK